MDHSARLETQGNSESVVPEQRKRETILLKEDEIIERLVPDPASVPEVKVFVGLLGKSTVAGRWRLYLYRATEEERFREAAEGAFAYERRWFDHGAGNWPDFRGDARPASAKAGSIPCATAWCHGAPGIILSRLRASDILTDDPQLREEIELGAGSTYRTTQLWTSSGTANYSLCHGLAGNAEVLIAAAGALGTKFDPVNRLASEIAAIGIDQYLEPGKAWPCGVAGGENHSLMLGLAGIGYFYLRLNDRAVPSLLLLHGDSFCPGQPRSLEAPSMKNRKDGQEPDGVLNYAVSCRDASNQLFSSL